MIKFNAEDSCEIITCIDEVVDWLLIKMKMETDTCKCLDYTTLKPICTTERLKNTYCGTERECNLDFYCSECNKYYIVIYKHTKNNKESKYKLIKNVDLKGNFLYDKDKETYQKLMSECGASTSILKINDIDKTIIVNSIEYSREESIVDYSYIFKDLK